MEEGGRTGTRGVTPKFSATRNVGGPLLRHDLPRPRAGTNPSCPGVKEDTDWGQGNDGKEVSPWGYSSATPASATGVWLSAVSCLRLSGRRVRRRRPRSPWSTGSTPARGVGAGVGPRWGCGVHITRVVTTRSYQSLDRGVVRGGRSDPLGLSQSPTFTRLDTCPFSLR